MVIDLMNRLTVNPLSQVAPAGRIQEGQSSPQEGKTVPAGGKELPPAGQGADAAAAESAARAIVDLNEYVQKVGREIRFSVDEDSGQTVIKVMNSETDEMIRQIPPDEVLALAEFVRDAQGLNTTGLSEKA